MTASDPRTRPGKAFDCGGLGCRSFALLGATLLLFSAHLPVAAEPARPQRIVSLDLCVDQMLVDLVPRERIAAVTHLAADPSVSAIPERARGLPVTRGGAEDVLRREPDLILAGPYGVSATVSLLQRLGRNVVIVPQAADLDGVRAAVRQVANAVGEEAKGAKLIARFDARLSRVASEARARSQTQSALIYQVGGSASGAGTLAEAALVAAGFRNAASDYVLTRSGQVPLESLVARPPDLLVLASTPSEYRTVIADNLRHPALQAVKRRVASLEMPWRMWLCGTPHIADAVEALAAAHP